MKNAKSFRKKKLKLKQKHDNYLKLPEKRELFLFQKLYKRVIRMIKQPSFIFFAYAPEDREYAQRVLEKIRVVEKIKKKGYRIITNDYPEYYPDELVYEMLSRNIEDCVTYIVILSEEFIKYSSECKFRSCINENVFQSYIFSKKLIIINKEDDPEFPGRIKELKGLGYFDHKAVLWYDKI